jgi:hypothetical protein
VNKSIPIGTMTALFPASPTSASSFTFNVTAGLKTGTYLIKVVDSSPDESPLGQFYIVVSSTQYIVLSDYVEDMSKTWQIDLPARYAGVCLRLLLFRPSLPLLFLTRIVVYFSFCKLTSPMAHANSTSSTRQQPSRRVHQVLVHGIPH